MIENKRYFCINCFKDKNIKQYIKSHGETGRKNTDCKFCNSEIENFSFKIEQKKFILKLKEAIKKLYSYDWNDTYSEMTNNALKNFVEDNEETPEKYTSLVSINDIENTNESKPICHYESLENIFLYFKIGNTDKFDDIFQKYVVSPEEDYRAGKDGDTLEDWNIDKHIWKNKCLYTTEEYKLQLWDNFCNYTKHSARYFNNQNVLDVLDKFKLFFKKMIMYDDRIIFRARPIKFKKDEEDINQKPERELGKVPLDKLKYAAKNNRFSPIGISYGYYSFDKQTILSEVRANIHDKVAMGQFQLSKHSKLIDFRKVSIDKYLNPFCDNFDSNIYCEVNFIKAFITDISKPINDNETALEYVPTQIIAEYIWSLGYDGFIFDSSQNKGGENLVLFGENPICKNHKFISIKEKNTKYIYEEL